MKNEDSEKLLVLRKKYHNKCPADTSLNMSGQSVANVSGTDAGGASSSVQGSNRGAALPSTPTAKYTRFDAESVTSPYLTPPPYKPPPPVHQQPVLPRVAIVSPDTQEQYRECVDEFKWALNAFSGVNSPTTNAQDAMVQPAGPPADVAGSVGTIATDSGDKENDAPPETVSAPVVGRPPATLEKQISVKEATKKFNLIASEEEVKSVTSPPAKKQPPPPSASSSSTKSSSEKVSRRMQL